MKQRFFNLTSLLHAIVGPLAATNEFSGSPRYVRTWILGSASDGQKMA